MYRQRRLAQRPLCTLEPKLLNNFSGNNNHCKTPYEPEPAGYVLACVRARRERRRPAACRVGSSSPAAWSCSRDRRRCRRICLRRQRKGRQGFRAAATRALDVLAPRAPLLSALTGDSRRRSCFLHWRLKHSAQHLAVLHHLADNINNKVIGVELAAVWQCKGTDSACGC